ncbi:MAG: hypothetical protein WBM27_07730 [bacterium]
MLDTGVCRECGSHWTSLKIILRCPVCHALTEEGKVAALVEEIQNHPEQSNNLEYLSVLLSSDNPIHRKAASRILAKAQTHSAFQQFLSAAHKARSEIVEDILGGLFYYPQYSEELMPYLLTLISRPNDVQLHLAASLLQISSRIPEEWVEAIRKVFPGIRIESRLFFPAGTEDLLKGVFEVIQELFDHLYGKQVIKDN